MSTQQERTHAVGTLLDVYWTYCFRLMSSAAVAYPLV